MDSPTPSAPAQPAPEVEPVVSAAFDAATKGDFSAFDKAHLASQQGKPLPDVPVDTEAVEAKAAPAPQVSKRQQQINNYERLIAEQTAEIARLKSAPAPVQQPAKPAEAAAPGPMPVAEWKRLSALPDAPKLDQFESLEDHTAAMALFIANKTHEERVTADRQKQDLDAFTSAQVARSDAFKQRIDEAKAADPEFATKLTDEVKFHLKPFDALKPGEPNGPINVIGELVYDSPVTASLLLHFSQHPDDLKRLTTVPESIQKLPATMRTRAHTAWMVKEVGKLEGKYETPPAAPEARAVPSTITAAPPPPPTLSRAGSTTDPMRSAVARNDFVMFDKLETQKLRDKRRA